MDRLRGSTLLEAVVAAVVFLAVFACVMELLPRLAVRGDEGLLAAEAEYRTACALAKYGTGVWPCGEYAETVGECVLSVQVAHYRDFEDIRLVTVRVRIGGSGKRIERKMLVGCGE